MKSALCLLLLAFAPVPGAAADGFSLSGSVAVERIGAAEDSRDAAKLVEYRDLSDGIAGAFDLGGRGDRFYFDAFAENLGRDDMFLDLSGGVYGRMKFRLRADWLTHNFGFGPEGARTPYENPGTARLTLFSTAPAELLDSGVPPWSSFKFMTERRNLEGSVELNGRSPWYVLLGGRNVSQSGINKVDAAALGTSPGNGFVDLPYPVDYSTSSGSLEAGYQTRRGHVSASFLRSDFGNDNMLLDFQNPFFGFGIDTATFAPDNVYNRVSASGMLRKLPWNATLSGRVTYDRVTDRVPMLDEVLNTSGSPEYTATAPSSDAFRGKVENATAQASYRFAPGGRLDVRAYYNYYRRLNGSTHVAFLVPLETRGLVCSEEGTESAESVAVHCSGTRYSYTKQNPGLEAEYRFNRDNRVSAGFDWLDTNRNRFDAEETGEKKLFVQWSNTSLDSASARVKYQYLRRRSRFLIENAGFDAGSVYYLERFNRSFDVANLDQHLLEADADWSPLPLLDFGFEAYYKRNDYGDLVLGRLADSRREFYGSISYGDPEKYRLTLFGDVEFIRYDSYHRTINAGACPATSPDCFDPRAEPTATAFNWSGRLKDTNWAVELAADWPLSPRLAFKLSAIVQESSGNVDFQAQTLEDGTPAAPLFPIGAYDDIKRRSIHPRAVYAFAPEAELTLGYAFEKFDYDDTQFDGYSYTIGSGTTASYLSGIYAFPGYRAHVAFATMRVRF